VSLLEEMREASGRDRIAYQYVTDVREVFESGVPAARTALGRGYSAEWAAVAVFLVFLSRFPDSHVGRKHGPEIARELIDEAQAAAAALEAAGPQQAMPVLDDLDRRLKNRGINPGTSADMTVASLVAAALEDSLDRRYHAGAVSTGT
ncbi:MAG: triphosphoribosyl-dephospho-CoA synthase, partial [Burkholderiales bacterium]